MPDLSNIRKSICKISKLIYEKDLTDSCGGNISVRDGNKIFITQKRSGETFQWEIEEDSIIVTDLCGIPIHGDIENISRESIIHYSIYQNFPDINAVFHTHPFNIMVFGAAHLEIPAVSEAVRHFLGEYPVTCIEETVPGSLEMAKKVIENFKERRRHNPPTPALLCNLPFHGVFVASKEINHTFITLESAERNARMIIQRKLMFENNAKADLSIHKKLTFEERESIENVKELCEPGFKYIGPFGEETTYNSSLEGIVKFKQNMIEKITEEVLGQFKKQQL